MHEQSGVGSVIEGGLSSELLSGNFHCEGRDGPRLGQRQEVSNERFY